MHLRYTYNKRLTLSLRSSHMVDERNTIVVKTHTKHARTATKLITLNKQNRQLRRLLGLSPSLTVYQ